MKISRTIMLSMTICCILMVFAINAKAESVTGEIASEVTTKETGMDGVRHSATAEWTKFTVPAGYAIVKDDTRINVVSEHGSEYGCDIQYHKDVEVVPDTNIKQPTEIWARAWARGPSGNASGRGWYKVKVTFRYVKYK